ncbi:neutral/alkaline non-lysosomal ceramidase N-terminal domain-containing protein [Tellurirhabdus bombi]|uniref:neutral/alkaline non-lysosomal ceramidase N-terminal domain-containing protein n=1 Tax=Tellurirhabdus bombi TaxID=2907205 RepID=UPI001F249EA4|nr:neutral/alkaline non-lysosomal ceramidase N-terminal domain-containing protein [Tellurirhabdus bombi]
MKYVRILLKVLLGLVIFLGLFLAVSLSPVDYTPYQQTAYYRLTNQRLRKLAPPPKPKMPLQAGWAKVNITPPYTTPTGGYGARWGKHWESVHDSIYVRAIVLDNGSTKVALVALDLLITPPTVTEQLKKRLPEIGFRWEDVYTGAIHSHNSLGGWAPGLVGRLFSGKFDQRIIDRITDAILKSIVTAQQQLAPAALGFTDVSARPFIYNRLNNAYPVDDKIRLLKLQKTDGTSALLCTYSGHATIVNMKAYQFLSRDYPGALVDKLEKETGGFAAFMAGAVGSTGSRASNEKDRFVAIDQFTDSLMTRISPALTNLKTRPDSALGVLTLPLALREPSPRILGDWRVRPGLFYSLYGNYPSDLKALRIGQTVLLGAPCDFSGELVPAIDQVATQKGFNLMVTSFDGGYVGYITPDKYYQLKAYETQTMNWFGPYNGAYFTEMMQGLLRKF